MSGYHRGECVIEGCTNLQHDMGRNKYGKHTYRKKCARHHYENLASRNGMTVSQWMKQWHPYKNHRKNYCENAMGTYAGWLPVPCSVEVFEKKFLHIDHVDGDHKNNDPDNLITLCPTCHAVKTWIFDCVSHEHITPIAQEEQHELGLET